MLWKQLLSAAVLLRMAAAQVHSDCNPYEGDECDPNPAFGTSHHWSFNTTPNGQLWETQVGPIHYDDEGGARFTINKQGDSPTLRTKFYFFFGRVEMLLKASPGRGIVSSMMLLSDDLDEVDWEFIGTNGSASTNFYGKGIQDYTNGAWHDVPVPVQDDYHNYTTIWTKEKMDFYINDGLVRTVNADESTSNGTDIYPQTPMRMSLGIWAGGDPSLAEWTRVWAGGDTDYDAGPYDMYVKEVYIEDFSSGKEYVWGDDSGSWESIEIVDGNSTAAKVIQEKPEKSLNEKFNDLPQAAKISIYAGGAAVAAVMVAGLIFYCIKQRRRGSEEARMALQRAEADRMELNRLQKSGIDPDSFTEHGAEYNARDMQSGGMTGDNSYNINSSSTPLLDNEKQWGAAAAAGAGAAGVGAAAMRSHTQSPRVNSPGPNSYHDPRNPGSPNSLSHGGYASPPPAGPMMRSPGSPGPQQAYGAHRMQQSPAPGPMSYSGDQGYAVNRMQSPGPGPMAPVPMSPPTNFNGDHSYGMDRMNSPGPHGYR